MAERHLVNARKLVALIGLEPGMAVVETINDFYPMRYLRSSMKAGQLDLSKAAVRRAIGDMVPAVITREQARILWAEGRK